MFIQVEELRKVINDILTEKRPYRIVSEIKAKGGKIHSQSLTNFLNNKEVTVSTLEALDNYATEYVCKDVGCCSIKETFA